MIDEGAESFGVAHVGFSESLDSVRNSNTQNQFRAGR